MHEGAMATLKSEGLKPVHDGAGRCLAIAA